MIHIFTISYILQDFNSHSKREFSTVFSVLVSYGIFLLSFGQISSSNYNFLAYMVSKPGRCFVTRNGHKSPKDLKMCRPLVMLFRRLLTNIEGSKRAMCREYFLRDLRNTREKLKGKELKKVSFCHLIFH